MDNQQQLLKLVSECVEEWNEQQERKIPIELGLKTPLYSKEGYVDSIGLVSILVSIEQAVEEQWGSAIDLTNQTSAMFQKDSPYKSVGSLVAYLDTLLSGKELDHVH